MRRYARGLLIAVTSLLLILGGQALPAVAAPTQEPQAPVVTGRPAVTPVVTSIPAQGVISARSTQGGNTELATVPPRATSAFNLVGATWTARTGQVTLQIRTESAAGWSDWTELTTTDGQDANVPARSTDPLYVGDSTGVELRATGSAGSSVTGLAVSTVSSSAVAADANLVPITAQSVATTTGVPQPAIVSRAGWAADESIRPGCSTTYGQTVKAAVIHHTAGSNSYTAAASASIVRGIYAYHVQSNGWCDIGYNFLIDKYGTIFEGRWGGIDRPVHGAHAGSWNTNTMGVSFMMNSDTMAATEASMVSATALLAWKLGGYYRDPNGTTTLVGATSPVIFRHGDVMSTACPGANLWPRLQEIRDRTGAVMGNRQRTPLYSFYLSIGGDGSSLGPVNGVERSVGDGRAVKFYSGSAYQRPDSAIFWLGAELTGVYDNAGGPTGRLGWPTGNQVQVRPGVVSATFQNGSLIFPDTRYVALVKASYQDFLGRQPNQTEIDMQTRALSSGASERSYLNGLATSNEWLNAIVTNLYRNTLGRTPGQAELAGWVAVLRNGQLSVAQVAGLFYGSDEFYSLRGGNTTKTWVTELYRQILLREPDAGGLTAWSNLTNSRTVGRDKIAETFYQSVESREDRVKVLYQSLLKRDPDPTGWPYWTQQVLTTGDIMLAISLASSQEYWDQAKLRYP